MADDDNKTREHLVEVIPGSGSLGAVVHGDDHQPSLTVTEVVQPHHDLLVAEDGACALAAELDPLLARGHDPIVAHAEPDAEGFCLSDDQARAFDAVFAWLDKPTPFLTLGGYAGTGKSTLIGQIRSFTRARIAVCAYTGKAAHALRGKGLPDARTIHSLIYQPREVCDYCDAVLGEGDVCTRYRQCHKAGTSTQYSLVPALEFDLIIVDEASMVSSEIHEDLLSFGIPILYVGDHGQLEPIGSNPRLMVDPVLRLEQIHRQAEGSAILKFAHHVRQHGHPYETGPDARVIIAGKVPTNAHEYDVVLCGRNTTRVATNELIRRKRKYTSKQDPHPLPIPGERVVCLRNHRDYGLFNGMLATVDEIRMDYSVDHPEIDIIDDDGKPHRGMTFVPEQFGNEEKMEHASRRRALFDFGYCLTAHKSQGSEWDRVLVLEWIHRDWSKARWRYTAATRAKRELVWCMHR